MSKFNQPEFVPLLEEIVNVSPAFISTHVITFILYRRE